ncbi:hypothetical protein ACHAXM_011977 [Skeletonema potamos]
MSDHIEEQEMEAEALSAIFDTAFTIRSSTQPFQWCIKLVPIDCSGDDITEESTVNHVMVNVVATIPPNYPESALPIIHIEILKGLSAEHQMELCQLAQEEALANEGMPAIFAVCEVVRAWLADNNVKGLDDASMHAQMMRKAKEVERREAQSALQFEAQKTIDEMTEAEQEELAVRKRREEGTPVNDETFTTWWAKFCKEMEEKKDEEDDEITAEEKEKKKLMAERLTGYQIFSEKSGVFNLEKLEAAAEEMENDVGDVDEELFDDEEDLDDLDFDSDEEDDDDEDDSEEEEPDI